MSNNNIADCVNKALDEYFKDLDGQEPRSVYEMLLNCMEKPLLHYVMHRAGGNQSRAAEMLGLNRNTLRKKLKQHLIE